LRLPTALQLPAPPSLALPGGGSARAARGPWRPRSTGGTAYNRTSAFGRPVNFRASAERGPYFGYLLPLANLEAAENILLPSRHVNDVHARPLGRW